MSLSREKEKNRSAFDFVSITSIETLKNLLAHVQLIEVSHQASTESDSEFALQEANHAVDVSGWNSKGEPFQQVEEEHLPVGVDDVFYEGSIEFRNVDAHKGSRDEERCVKDQQESLLGFPSRQNDLE